MSPSIDRHHSDWLLLQRDGLSMAGASYKRGVSVHAPSTVTIDLNRPCSAYDGLAGVDDLTLAPGAVRFSVLGDDDRSLWRSPALHAGDAPVPVHVPLAGQHSIQLVVTPVDGYWSTGILADWANAQFSC
ncbi:NPCBM/NEW2 domain-containing protein [Kitasatospora azatica]|uniref:NPCBM/NEW2 domain-containing protein n=1 Tax=Kitasatospora azatica TaxID=58347 RepID=UPI001E5E8233|nr:NPCBM/NEW2 domain-containing protein [Kitasatospora azatica]